MTLTPSREREEYRALRATIRERGTARIAVFACGLGVWGALAVLTAVAWPVPAATLVPLVVLAGEDRVIVGIGDALDERIDVISNVPGVTDVNSGWFGYSRRSDGDATAYVVLDGRVACPLPGEYPIRP